MDDIVERLRGRASHVYAEGTATAAADAWDFKEAADEIERLRAQVATASKDALEEAVDCAATKWRGEKDRETFNDDTLYFKNNWRALPWLRRYVADAFLALAEKEQTR